MKKNKAFTLAETMIVLVILGLVAAISVPALMERATERQNITKIKKATAVYDTAMNKIVVENNLKSEDALNNWANNDGNCTNARAYFKSSQQGATGCIFKASDGLWWDITTVTKPLISIIDIDENNAEQTLEKIKGYASDSKNNISFYMISQFDENGSFRVNDYQIVSKDNMKDLKKLFTYLGQKPSKNTKENYCNCSGKNCCNSNCTGEICKETSISQKCNSDRSAWTIYGGSMTFNSANLQECRILYSADRKNSAALDLYNNGIAFAPDGGIFKIVDGNLTYGKNMGGNNLSDMVWDSQGNLIKAKSTSLGYCDKNSCSMNPSPLTAEACQNGKACYYDAEDKEWKSGLVPGSWMYNDLNTFYTENDNQVWEWYQEQANK